MKIVIDYSNVVALKVQKRAPLEEKFLVPVAI
jgi:hypothetical protein